MQKSIRALRVRKGKEGSQTTVEKKTGMIEKKR